MYEYYFTFRSVTSAQNAMMTLAEKGIPADFLRTPRFLSRVGCGYAVKLSYSDGYAAAAVLRQQQIKFERFVRLFPDGIIEEVRP